jgi:hypothetical protein
MPPARTIPIPALSDGLRHAAKSAPACQGVALRHSTDTESARLPDEPPPELQPANLQTVTVHLPLIHNPNKLGLRMPIWFGKIWTTLHEMQARFSGLKLSLGLGWCAEDRTWDPHLCVDFDAQITSETEHYLTWWSGVLRDRFRQRAVYMKLSSPVRWM